MPRAKALLKNDKQWEDTIVNEIRAIRNAHAEEFNYDLDAIFKNLKKYEKNLSVKVVTRLPRLLKKY